MTTIGIDNGSSGTIGILSPDGALFEATPTQDCLHYGKAGTITQRLDRHAFTALLLPHVTPTTRVYIERPFTGAPAMIKAMLSAHRFFEATITALEVTNLGYEVIDSKAWQVPVLGNVKGTPALKLASRLRGIQFYPALADEIRRHGDADGLLIAHHFHHRAHIQLP